MMLSCLEQIPSSIVMGYSKLISYNYVAMNGSHGVYAKVWPAVP